YYALVSSVLRRPGLIIAPVLITGVVQIDLDGDGAVEDIVSVTSSRLARDAGEALSRAEKGDCSFILLRSKSHGRTAITFLPGAYWYSKDATATINEIGGALDLNGDGKMEIIVRTHYYEGGGVRVFELRNGKPVEVLSAIDGA